MSYIINLSILKRNRNYRLLYTGQFVSFLGTMITNVALPFQVYQLSKSTLMVGLISLFQLLPLLITALIGGVLADRHHRRRLLLWSESLLAIGCLLLMSNALLPVPKIPIIFITATIMAAVTGLHRPALDSITQQIVDAKDYAVVGSLLNFMFSGGMIIGPAIGGLIIAHCGIVSTYAVDFASFLISLTTIIFIHNVPHPIREQNESPWQSLIAGCTYAISNQELIGTYLVDFVAMIFGMPMALFPAIAHHHGGPKLLGMLYAAPAVGALLISFFSGWTKMISRHGLAIIIAAVGWGLSIILFGITSNMFIALGSLALAGAFDGISGIFRQTMWNDIIPNHLRGRLAGIAMIGYLSGPKLGDTEAGLVAAAFGISCSVISGGVMCLIGVIACCFALPKFMQYRCQTTITSDKRQQSAMESDAVVGTQVNR